MTMKRFLIALGKRLHHVLPSSKSAGEAIRDATEPAVHAAGDRLDKSIDHAAQQGQQLLAEGEASARSVVEDVDQRLAVQRKTLLAEAEQTCDRIGRRLLVRVVLAGVAVVGAAGVVVYLLSQACRSN